MTYTDSAVLNIDLAALAQNFQTLDAATPTAQTAAVVKADGYGLGLAPVAEALDKAGCSVFFVAQAQEAIDLRALLPKPVIYVLNGLPDGAAADFAAHSLRPCLISVAQIEQWQAYCQKNGALPACLFIDTGFNRLGLGANEVADLADTPSLFEGWELTLIASHLACADNADHPMNAAQLEAFRHALSLLPKAPASLANSGGVMLGSAYHFDMVRVGIMLYGGAASGRPDDALAPVATLRAPILQIRHLSVGDTIGYGATFTAAHETTVGIVSLGYGDGLNRYFGANLGQIRLMLSGHPVPLLGRMSMDSLAIDLTDCPSPPQVHDMVELFGANNRIDQLAMSGQTISYELLTSLGSRYKRIYSD